jgi:hypothetical protein
MCRSRAALEEVYPRLVRSAVTTFSAVDVLRFLGKPVPASGTAPHRRRHEVVTNLTERVEGTRLKHWAGGNSVQRYDKGSVLRPETTLCQPRAFQVCRPAQGEPEGPGGPEFLLSGLRNRDLRRLLYGAAAGDPAEERRRSAAVPRPVRLLRAHGLLEKVPPTHRYLVTAHGRQAITALLAARHASTDLLTQCAA